jgi:hypothetical protein
MAQNYKPTAWTYAEIVKVEDDDDGSVRIYGRPTQEIEDADHQIADKKWIKDALPEWYQSGANIREMHQAKAIGKGEKLEFDKNDDPWLTARIIDPNAVKLVKEGVLQGFSIGIKDPLVKHDQNAKNGRIYGGKIVEVSAVDRPSVPTAKVELLKMVGPNEYMDMQNGFGLKIAQKYKPTKDEDFDEEGNPVNQPGHLKNTDAEPEIISQDTHSVVVKLGDNIYQVPIDMDGQGNVVVGTPELVPGTLLAEGTPGNPEVKMKATKKLEAAAKEVGIGMSDEIIIKAAMDAAMNQKVLCQACRKTVVITKSLDATQMDGGMRVQGIADCGHTVTKFVKDAEPEKKDPEEEKKEPEKEEKVEDPKKPESGDDDPELEKKFEKWARAKGLIKDAEPDEDKKADEARKNKIADLREAQKALAEKIDQYEKCSEEPMKKAADADGGPSRVEGTDPKEIIAELSNELKRMESLINDGEGQMEHAKGENGDGDLGEKPVPTDKKPEGDGQINLSAGDIKAVVADVVKSSLISQTSNKDVTPDIAKSVAEAVKGVLEPLTSRLEKVEHMAQPSPFMIAAEKHYSLNADEEKQSTAVKTVRDEMRKLSPKAQEQVLAQAIAKDRGWA